MCHTRGYWTVISVVMTPKTVGRERRALCSGHIEAHLPPHITEQEEKDIQRPSHYHVMRSGLGKTPRDPPRDPPAATAQAAVDT